MERPTPCRTDVIFAGLGGQGVLLAGLLLAEAGASEYANVVWTPSYATRVRGGPSECTVILSQEEICSPLLSRAQAVVLMQPWKLEELEGRVRPGGLLLVEAAGLDGRKGGRPDVRMLAVPGQEVALGLGDRMAANLVLLGACVAATGALPAGSVERELERRFGRKGEVLALNREAFRRGLELGREGRWT